LLLVVSTRASALLEDKRPDGDDAEGGDRAQACDADAWPTQDAHDPDAQLPLASPTIRL
jgi:hypothetical protein